MACADFDLFTEHFEYDWDTGRVLNRATGKPAGRLDTGGYYQMTFKRRLIQEHRVMWLLLKGEWPVELDHIDGNRTNNVLSNLRSVTRRENLQNKVCHRNGRLPGCTKNGKKWTARIEINKVRHYLGRYDSELEAHSVYLIACGSLPQEGC